MCVIAIKPRGVAMPTAETIETMFSHNPHGAGYMIARSGQVQIHKGYDTAECLLSALDDEKITDDDVIVIHCRISTGADALEMTHPYPLSYSLDDMCRWDTVANVGIAHNGTIPITAHLSDDYSDTALYITNIIYPLSNGKFSALEDRIIQNSIDNDINGSRMVFLNKDGKFITLGKWYKDKGIYYSNTSYKPYEYRRAMNYTDWWNKYIGKGEE